MARAEELAGEVEADDGMAAAVGVDNEDLLLLVLGAGFHMEVGRRGREAFGGGID